MASTRGKTDATLTVNAAHYKEMEKEHRQLKKQMGKLPQEHEELKANFTKLEEDNKHLRVQVAELLEQINKMKKKGRKGFVNRKSEQNEDIKEAIDECVKAVLFRTVKFAQNGNQLTQATKLVWEGIKDKKKLEIGNDALTVEDFCQIYESHVGTCLSQRRQYVQTQTQKAAEEWLETHETLPTVEEIQHIWSLPEAIDDDSSEDDKAEYKKKLEILTWYLDVFLPKGVGLEFWGDLIRPYHLMTDTVLVDGDLSGKKKVLVTVTSEAFAQLVYHNCRDKWMADHKYKKQHGKKAQVPKFNKKDVSTHVHVNKWSNSCSGSAIGGGWHKDALLKFNALKEEIKEFRSEQAVDGYPLFKYGQALIKTANQINMDSGKLSGKKRKSTKKDTQKEIEIIDITFEDE